jgi:hypothetical protein
MEVSDNE